MILFIDSNSLFIASENSAYQLISECAARAAPAKSRVRKRSVWIGGHKTGLSVEDEFWEGLSRNCMGTRDALQPPNCRLKAATPARELILGDSPLRAEALSPGGGGEGEAVTRGPALTAKEYRQLAADEAELAESASSNEIRARHCAMADYFTRLAEAQERLPRPRAAPAGKGKR
jgi:Ribbon-helix-helix domain